MTLSILPLTIFSIVGLIITSYYFICVGKALVYYVKFHSFPLTEKEQQLKILQQENKRLNEIISRLESETEEMTRALIQRLS